MDKNLSDTGKETNNTLVKTYNILKDAFTGTPLQSATAAAGALFGAMGTLTKAIWANTVAITVMNGMGFFKGKGLGKIFGLGKNAGKMSGVLGSLSSSTAANAKAVSGLGRMLGGFGRIIGGFGTSLFKISGILAAAWTAFQGVMSIIPGTAANKKNRSKFEGAGLDKDAAQRASVYSGITKLVGAGLMFTPFAPAAAVALIVDSVTGGFPFL